MHTYVDTNIHFKTNLLFRKETKNLKRKLISRRRYQEDIKKKKNLHQGTKYFQSQNPRTNKQPRSQSRTSTYLPVPTLQIHAGCSSRYLRKKPILRESQNMTTSRRHLITTLPCVPRCALKKMEGQKKPKMAHSVPSNWAGEQAERKIEKTKIWSRRQRLSCGEGVYRRERYTFY